MDGTDGRVLVTGATGRVGAPLVETLAADEPVRVASREPERARERFDAGADGTIEAVRFDLEHPETWGAALDGADRLFLLFPPSVGVAPVRRFVDAARRTGVERTVYLSVLGAEKVPVLPHRRIERHLADGDHTFLRAAYFMQNFTGIHRPEIAERDELFVPAGDGALGLVDARDVAAVAARALTEPGHAGRAYDLTGPESLDFRETASVFSDVLGRRITYPDPGRVTFARRMLGRGVSPGLVAFMLGEYEVTRRGLSGRTTDEVAAVLGRETRDLGTFVADHREAFEPAG
jgi:uncharacterized protein YbjT (DUF2867 family)